MPFAETCRPSRDRTFPGNAGPSLRRRYGLQITHKSPVGPFTLMLRYFPAFFTRKLDFFRRKGYSFAEGGCPPIPPFIFIKKYNKKQERISP